MVVNLENLDVSMYSHLKVNCMARNVWGVRTHLVARICLIWNLPLPRKAIEVECNIQSLLSHLPIKNMDNLFTQSSRPGVKLSIATMISPTMVILELLRSKVCTL